MRLWWQAGGRAALPRAPRRLLVTCDAGGSNGCPLPAVEGPARRPGRGDRAGDRGLPLPARHVASGTRSSTGCSATSPAPGAARPLMTTEDAVAGIAATITSQGLKCTAVLDDARLPRRGQGQRRADEVPRGTRHRPARVPRRVELRHPARPAAPPGRTRSRAAGPGPDLARPWPPWPASATCPPCWPPSPCPAPPPASSACTWTAAAARRKASGGGPWPAALRGHRHRRRLPPAAAGMP